MGATLRGMSTGGRARMCMTCACTECTYTHATGGRDDGRRAELRSRRRRHEEAASDDDDDDGEGSLSTEGSYGGEPFEEGARPFRPFDSDDDTTAEGESGGGREGGSVATVEPPAGEEEAPVRPVSISARRHQNNKAKRREFIALLRRD